MRVRARLLTPALAATVVLGFGVGGASAATLFTNGGHGTTVAVGATASATATSPVVLTSATSQLNVCNTSTLNLTLAQNSGGTVVGTITSGTFASCNPLPATGLFSPAWKLTVSGSPTTSGGVTSWAASVASVGFSLGGGTYTGNLTTGVTARQTGAGGAVSLNFNDAGTLSGPLTTNGRIDANYSFEGGASTYSLT
jgi:hypothetical protein